jgi:type I restriction enzyme, S subunit
MEKVKINDICNISNGYAFKSDKYISENGARVIRITNVQKGKIVDNDPKFYPFSELNKLDAYKIFEGDILMSLTGNVGRVGRYPKELLPAYINQRVCRVMPKNEKLDANFLFHFLNSDVFENEAIKNSAGAAQLNLSTKWLGDFEIPLPALATQQKIAAILDQADALIQNNRAIVQKYDALTQSLFLDMFGDITNNKKFQIGTIENLIDIVRDGPHVSPKYSENGIPILSTRNIRPFELVYEEMKYVSVETYNLLTRNFKPQKGDVLLTKGGTTGYAKIVDWDWEFCIWVHLAALRVKKDVSPKYIESALNSYYCYNQSQEQTRGIANKDLGLKRLIKIKLPIPPFELQNQFAERIAVIEAQKQQAQLELAKSEELFNSLLQRAFKGELN